ncbi:dermonecrotic toxin domain-containing protein [Pseudomonas sp. 32A]|uniref:dermonecrotic toxin domain-containing protein n=1 Tax=Pseudomonas sp. 32A TaxID=651185 RepID=UPI004045C99B
MTTNGPQLQRINHFVRKVLADFPVPSQIAAQLIREHVQPLSQVEFDPDTTLLTTLEYNTDNPNTAFTAVVVQSMSLTEAMVCNAPLPPGGMVNTTGFSTTAPYFNIVSELPRLMDNRIPTMFNEEFIVAGWIPPRRYEALYLKSQPQVYNPSTQLEISPEAFRRIVHSSDFEQVYDEAITQFWNSHRENYNTLMRVAFTKAYLEQFQEFTLTVAERHLAARAAGIGINKDHGNLTLEDFQAPYRADPNLSLRLLRIHNSEATDILSITDTRSQVTLLYIPGNSSPFHGFNSPADMRKWLVETAKDATQRKALTNHFDEDVVDSGLIYSGVEEALVGMVVFPKAATSPGFFNSLLVNGYWDPEQYINNPMYPALGSNPFEFIARQIRMRLAKMAARSITSPLDTFKTDTLDALEKACILAIPVALAMGNALLAEFCFLTYGATEMVVGTDDLLRGKPQGKARIVFGALNALPVVAHGVAKGLKGLENLRPTLGPAVRQDAGRISVTAINETSGAGSTETRTLSPRINPNGMQTLRIHGDLYLTFKTPNESGFFELFVMAPNAPNSLQSTGLYAIQSADLKWRTAGLAGGGAFRNAWQRVYTLFGGPEHSTFYSAYEMPPLARETVSEMLTDTSSFSENLEPTGSGAQPIKDTRKLFFEKRTKLSEDATVFFANLPFSPMRPVLPRFSLNESQPSIIQKLLHASDGLVIGESHGALSSKAFLIDNMQLLASQGVKRIYFEHLLTDVHMPLLKAFYRTRSAVMPEELKGFLNNIYPPLRDQHYSFVNIVTKARDAGIKIQPIDCTVSYMLRDLPDTADNVRQRMMNYYATEVIQWTQTTKARPGKWVALVGDSHTNTYNGIPGIAELTGSIGLRIEDAAAGGHLGIEVDTGRTASLGIGKGEGTVKAHLVLRVDNATLQRPAQPVPGPSQPAAKTPQTQLTKPGQFMLTSATATTPAHVHYRSRRGDVRHFRIDQQGSRYAISAPGWAVDGKPFDSIQALVDEFKAPAGLEQVTG